MERRKLGKSFDSVMRADSDEAPIPLESVSVANVATTAFHMQLLRLAGEASAGELVLVNRNGNDGRLGRRPVLRLRIG